MNQYEKEHALFQIDGYWMPRPAPTNEKLREDFEKAKSEFITNTMKRIGNVKSITFEQFKDYKGETLPAPMEER